jgi:hypothetical protein
VAFAVKVGELATPDVLVGALEIKPPPANVPLAPDAGALKVTFALAGFPYASLTITTSGLPNAFFTGAVWPLPEVAVMLAAGPALFVRAKLAGDAAPATIAVAI